MSAINLSKTDINNAARTLNRVFKDADTNKTGVVYPKEINKFQGEGKAALKKIYEYARHIEGGKTGDDFVRLSTAKTAIDNLAHAVKNAAINKGDKDNRLDGAELHYLSNAGAALVRFAQALKND